jgi:hypothetical protein
MSFLVFMVLNGGWGKVGGGSGLGNSMESTVHAGKHIADVLKKFNIWTMIDASCGLMA